MYRKRKKNGAVGLGIQDDGDDDDDDGTVGSQMGCSDVFFRFGFFFRMFSRWRRSLVGVDDLGAGTNRGVPWGKPFFAFAMVVVGIVENGETMGPREVCSRAG